MKAIPSSKFAVFWRKVGVKRARAPVSPVMWNKERRTCLQPTKSHGQLYQEKSDGKRKPQSLAPVLGSYLRRGFGPPDSSHAHHRTWKNKQPFHTAAISTKTQLRSSLQRSTVMTRVGSSTKEVVSTKQQRWEVWFCHDMSISHILCLHFTWCYYWTTLKGKC